MEIIWSENAEITFEAIVFYIEAKFGKIASDKFVLKTDSTIRAISNYPFIFKEF